ncbi:hypothetical protein ON010_g7950 [Phytophthora cinnamomi]|nr:hypothetical protein ON010_g7950 [Phytophthora cinnamomi]
MLGGYRWEHDRLYYKVTALKAFGMLKMEDDNDVTYLVLQKLHWFTAPKHCLVIIGIISGQRVEPCKERVCAGTIGFLHRKLGGALDIHHQVRPNQVESRLVPDDIVLPETAGYSSNLG